MSLNPTVTELTNGVSVTWYFIRFGPEWEMGSKSDASIRRPSVHLTLGDRTITLTSPSSFGPSDGRRDNGNCWIDEKRI